MRIVAITGAPGAGKTEVARRLVARYAVPAAVVDTDGIAGIQPFTVDEKLYRLVAHNLAACLDGYRAWGARVVVLSGVLLPDGILSEFGDLLADSRLDWVFYGLRASRARLAERILGDGKFQDAEGRLSWSHADGLIAGIPGIRSIDTDALSIDEVVTVIAAHEPADLLGLDPVPAATVAPAAALLGRAKLALVRPCAGPREASVVRVSAAGAPGLTTVAPGNTGVEPRTANRAAVADQVATEATIVEASALDAPDAPGLTTAALGQASVEPGVTDRAAAEATIVEVSATEVLGLARAAFVKAGVESGVASQVAAELLDAELAGCPSHGVQRVPEYAAALHAGAVVADARPQVRRTGPGSAVVEAHRAFGVLARDTVVEQLCTIADEAGFAVVGLREAGHLGRLRPIATAAATQGLVLLGFVNCGGAGQKVVPPGGTTGRLATNPVVIGCPAPPGPPVIVDTSTSATSEGAVRVAAQLGHLLPDGLLVDRAGHSVHDPGALYTDPPSAGIAPLGGKGFALAAAVEVLAGIVAGAGFSDTEVPKFSNGGLFVAFPVGVLGRDADQVGAEVARLERHLASGAARLPGRGPRSAAAPVRLPSSLWQQIRSLAGGHRVRSLV